MMHLAIRSLGLKSEMNGYGEIAAYGGSDTSLSEPGKPGEMADGFRVSANLLPTLGIGPQLGRSFRPDEALMPARYASRISLVETLRAE